MNMTEIVHRLKSTTTNLQGFLRENRLVRSQEGLRVWDSSHATSSQCSSTPLMPVTFLDDSQTGCFLNLVRTNFSDCADLRRTVKAIQDHLTPGVLLSKGGGATADLSKDDFFQVITAPPTPPTLATKRRWNESMKLTFGHIIIDSIVGPVRA